MGCQNEGCRNYGYGAEEFNAEGLYECSECKHWNRNPVAGITKCKKCGHGSFNQVKRAETFNSEKLLDVCLVCYERPATTGSYERVVCDECATYRTGRGQERRYTKTDCGSCGATDILAIELMRCNDCSDSMCSECPGDSAYCAGCYKQHRAENFDEAIQEMDREYAEMGITSDATDLYYELVQQYGEDKKEQIKRDLESFYQIDLILDAETFGAENYRHECITCAEGMDELVAKGQTWSCECCGFLVGTQGKHEDCGYNDNGEVMCYVCYTGQCDCASFSAEYDAERRYRYGNRYITRDSKGRFKKNVDVGRSLSADRRRKAKTVVKGVGQGGSGDYRAEDIVESLQSRTRRAGFSINGWVASALVIGASFFAGQRFEKR